MPKLNLFICFLAGILLYFSNYSIFCLLVIPIYFLLSSKQNYTQTKVYQVFKILLYILLSIVIIGIGGILLLLFLTY